MYVIIIKVLCFWSFFRFYSVTIPLTKNYVIKILVKLGSIGRGKVYKELNLFPF